MECRLADQSICQTGGSRKCKAESEHRSGKKYKPQFIWITPAFSDGCKFWCHIGGSRNVDSESVRRDQIASSLTRGLGDRSCERIVRPGRFCGRYEMGIGNSV